MSARQFFAGTKVLVNWDLCNRIGPEINYFCDIRQYRSLDLELGDIERPLTIDGISICTDYTLYRLKELNWWVPEETLRRLLPSEMDNDKRL